jgi:hypothetical protein
MELSLAMQERAASAQINEMSDALLHANERLDERDESLKQQLSVTVEARLEVRSPLDMAWRHLVMRSPATALVVALCTSQRFQPAWRHKTTITKPPLRAQAERLSSELLERTTALDIQCTETNEAHAQLTGVRGLPSSHSSGLLTAARTSSSLIRTRPTPCSSHTYLPTPPP